MILFVKRVFCFPFKIVQFFYYSYIFKQFKWYSKIDSPLRIDGGNSIYIGNKVLIKYKTWLASVPITRGDHSELIIEDGCVIGHFNHIYSTSRIVLHKNVLTADRVYISDNLHGYSNINIPIINQPIVQNKSVEIGEGSWIGENACILGAHIGKNCVIGANSVVTKDIPDYSVAVGAPAKVIKQYDIKTKMWKKICCCESLPVLSGGGNSSIEKNYYLCVA